jgi:hypothetical protein
MAVATRASAQAEASAQGEISASDIEGPVSAPDDTSDALYERGGLANAGLSLGLKLGAGFSQPFGDLGTGFLSEFEVGYALPVAKRSFALFVSGAYTQPGADRANLNDARLPGAASYVLSQQELMLTLGITYRLHLPTKLLRPYASIGPRVFLMRTKISGSAGGQAFGANEETATDVGALGAELHFGPGAALIELSMTWAHVDGYVLRDTSAGALGAAVGYRVFL